ncbi:hypothetical protein V502_03689 [Pseudogymnoascus sp. VKM F-4520 (FW-2644)]|nr:hypothetical protein V502_03689 [Pseudogymnoascus sp. VKM F-4520 (FW-2644)]
MRSAVLLSVVSALAATTAATDAPEVTGNPSNIGYTARLPSSSPIKGALYIYAPTTGDGTTVQFDLSNLPSTGGPYAYHIHELPANSTGSCASTGGHLDPYNAGTATCDPAAPATCQVGDLSGKHGAVPPHGIVINYSDAYLSIVKDTPAFIGNRSFVVHDASGARIACANFEFHEGGGLGLSPGSASSTGGAGSAGPTGGAGGSNGTVTSGGAGPSKTAAVPSITPTGAAGVVSGSVVGILGVLAVGAALL